VLHGLVVVDPEVVVEGEWLEGGGLDERVVQVEHQSLLLFQGGVAGQQQSLMLH